MNRLTFEERKKANKIRSKLLTIIDKDLREVKKNNRNHMLINSMTLKEIEDKYLLFPNYKMKLTTTFTKNANKYIVVKIVDNRLKQNFYYTDYYQEQQESNQCFVKTERKRVSCNDLIKIKYLGDEQELQSPLPELFTNKMDIGDKKLIKPENKENFSDKKKLGLNKLYTLKEYNKNENSKNNKKQKMKLNDDDSINSLTLDLIQKKASMFSSTLNDKNKKELKRRKNQLEAIRKLRQFCFQKLRNKRTCKTKSSQRNLLYINPKFEEEDEKNNTSYSSKKAKNNTKNNRKLSKMKTKNNSKKKYDGISESKKRKCTFRKSKEKKKIENNSRKLFRNNSTKKSPLKPKPKILLKQRKSLVSPHNIISGKLETDILRFKKHKKEKSDNGINIHQTNKPEGEVTRKPYVNEKLKTGILRDSFREKLLIKNQFNFNKKMRRKFGTVIFNEVPTTKRISSDNNFFNRKYKSKNNNLKSSLCLIKPIKYQIKRKESECRSERIEEYSTPNKHLKTIQKSEKSFNKSSYKKFNDVLTKSLSKFDKKEKMQFYKALEKKISLHKEKIKNHNIMQKVEEEED